MCQLFIPWLLVVLLIASIILLFFKRLWWLSIVLVIVVLLLNCRSEVVAFNLSVQKESDGILKVMTWNIDGSSPTILDNINKISQKIRQENADVVFIAEDFYQCCDALDTLLKPVYPFTTHIVCNDSHYFYSKYPLSKSEWIGKEIDPLSCIIECYVDIEGQKIALYGCHLSSNNYSGGKENLRAEQIHGFSSLLLYLQNVDFSSRLRKEECGFIANRVDFNTLTFIMGDMNDVAGSPALRILGTSGYKNAWWKGGSGYGATIHSPVPYRIDHILYRQGLKGLKLNSIKKIDAEGLSDHDALVAEFIFEK